MKIGVAERFQGANIIDAGRLSPYWGEHAARYKFSLPFVEDKRVLDIACGTGYGIALLTGKAKHVTGVDVDTEAVKQAKTECSTDASVLLGDGLNLPFSDESFDVITSFETLEHLYDRNGFLSELARVLQTNGTLVLSTPNANYTMPVNGKPSNPFHVFEYQPEELRNELENYFIVEKLMGQSLNKAFGIPPFSDAQEKLPKNFAVQFKLFGWKVMNKLPIKTRESISEAIWKKPFYPLETDYDFDTNAILSAPVLVVVCRKPN